MKGHRIILSKDVTNGVITTDSEGVMILNQSGKILLFDLNDDLNGNNVLLDATHEPVLIDFGKKSQGKDFKT